MSKCASMMVNEYNERSSLSRIYTMHHMTLVLYTLIQMK